MDDGGLLQLGTARESPPWSDQRRTFLGHRRLLRPPLVWAWLKVTVGRRERTPDYCNLETAQTIQKSSPLTRVGPLSQNGNGSWTCFLSSICVGQVRHNNNDKQDITTVTNDTFSLAPLLVWTQMILPPKTQEFWHEKSCVSKRRRDSL